MYVIAFGQNLSSSNAYSQGYLGGMSGKFRIGRYGGVATDGAYRFPSVAISQGATVSSARLYIYSQYNSTGTIRFKTYGIKEVNTATFSGNPFGRTKTTTSYSDSKSVGTRGYFDTDVTSIVNEIVGQGSWSSGNAMGFLVFDNSSDSNSDSEDWNPKGILLIRFSATPNLLPSPVIISAPTFPPATNYGIRVSEPGIDVKEAEESQLFFTTRKKEFRVSSELEITSEGLHAHGLSYAPCTLGYFTDANNRKRIMNTASDQFSVQPWIASNDTYIYTAIDPVSGNPAYIYIFIDPLT